MSFDKRHDSSVPHLKCESESIVNLVLTLLIENRQGHKVLLEVNAAVVVNVDHLEQFPNFWTHLRPEATSKLREWKMVKWSGNVL